MEDRTVRIAAVLEEQLGRCQSALGDCLAGIGKRGEWREWEMRIMLNLMKTSAQLAGVIGRLEARRPSEKNGENSGSIPQ
jgi:hypothetical protein